MVINSRYKDPFYSSVTVKHKEKTNKNVLKLIKCKKRARAASTRIKDTFKAASNHKKRF